MYQALLLSSTDIATLRASLSVPQFESLAKAVPGLTTALTHPLPDFSACGDLVLDAVREVRANTNNPEDWDDLSDAVSAVRQARKKFVEAVKVGDCHASVPMKLYILVEERIGSNDGPSFEQHVYADYTEACEALKVYAEKCFDPVVEDHFRLEEYSVPERGEYCLSLMTGRSVSCQFYLKNFTFPQAGVTEGSRA
jgi:hypothetical protein